MKEEITSCFRRLYRALLDRRAEELGASALAASAIVFSPHPDDETLACGGTIIRKVLAGARVDLVILTDGRRSHAKYMKEETLKELRAGEALAAAKVMGVRGQQVHFLECPDSKLEASAPQVMPLVAEMLSELRPQQVFVPYHRETPKDHLAANHVVRSAMRQCKLSAEVYEYPVWYWCHWPWIGLPPGRRAKIQELAAAPLRAATSARELRRYVDVTTVLPLKQAALEQYKTQMTRLCSPDWPVLADVHDGCFLRTLLQDRERFLLRQL